MYSRKCLMLSKLMNSVVSVSQIFHMKPSLPKTSGNQTFGPTELPTICGSKFSIETSLFWGFARISQPCLTPENCSSIPCEKP